MRISDWSSDVFSSDLIVTDTDVRRILFTNKRAAGVVIRDKAGERTVKVGQEIILSAGAIQSPKLLQLSGIGPAALLSSLGIEVVADAPDVGRNLLEHRYLSTQYRVRGESLNARFGGFGRSEEHTSELQSLMRISYAVFCL